MLRVKDQIITVEIIGAKIACSQGLRDDWRNLAEWIGSKFDILYNGRVITIYYDLFDENHPLLPENAKLPVVIVDHEIFSMGGKIAMSLIRKKIDEIIKSEND